MWRSPPLTTEAALEAVLHRARTVGFLGPGPISFHVEHAQAFADALPPWVERFVDIGSGGGIPGLPMALARPDLTGYLLDASQKRTAFLVWAVAELGLTDRIEVITGRAELVAREPQMRASVDAVVSRGFGPPAMTVECAAGLVREGGLVVISEPPERRSWPAGPLAQLGLVELDDQAGDSARLATDADDEASRAITSLQTDSRETDSREIDSRESRSDLTVNQTAVEVADEVADEAAEKTSEKTSEPAGRVVVFRRDGELPDRFPRGAKALKRQPLFDL